MRASRIALLLVVFCTVIPIVLAQPTIVFASDWGDSVGRTEQAIRDGGVWDAGLSINPTEGTDPAEVIITPSDIGFPADMQNVLEIEFKGNGDSRMLTKTVVDDVPVGESIFYRFYYYYYPEIKDEPVGKPHWFQPPAGAHPGSGAFSWVVGSGRQWEDFHPFWIEDGSMEVYRQHYSYTQYQAQLEFGKVYRIEIGFHRYAEDAADVDFRIYDESLSLTEPVWAKTGGMNDIPIWPYNSTSNDRLYEIAPVNLSVDSQSRVLRQIQLGNNGPWTEDPSVYFDWFLVGGFVAVTGADFDSSGPWIGPYRAGESVGDVLSSSLGVLAGDVNSDGVVNVQDLLILVDNFRRTSQHSLFDARADRNGDGVVNVFDLVLVARQFGLTAQNDPPSLPLDFSSDWDAELGTSDAAVRDGGVWPVQRWNDGGLTVVEDTDFPSSRALRIGYGGLYGSQGQEVPLSGDVLVRAEDNLWPVPEVGQTLFHRYYVKNAIRDEVGNLGYGSHHPFQGFDNTVSPICTLEWEYKYGARSDGTYQWALLFFSSDANSEWSISGLPKFTTQLHEVAYTKVAPNQYEVRVRIDGEERTQDFVGGANGALRLHNDNVHDISDHCLRTLFLGNNDPVCWLQHPGCSGSDGSYDSWPQGPFRDTDFFYWGSVAVAVRDDPNAWIGAYGSGQQPPPVEEPPVPVPVWNADDWSQYFVISTNSDLVFESNTNLYYDLSLAPQEFWTYVNSSGKDIRVVRESDLQEVALEVTGFNYASQTGSLFFNSSGLSTSSSTSWRVYYGNPSAEGYAPSDVYGSHNVWDEHYQGVWHLNGASATDSTRNVNTGTLSGTLPTLTQGKVGLATVFNGVDDSISLGNPSALRLTGPSTISLWYQLPSNEYGVYGKLLSKMGGSGSRGWDIQFEDWGGEGGLQQGALNYRVSTTGSDVVSSDYYVVSNDVSEWSYDWHHVAGVFIPGVGPRLFVDAQSVGGGTSTASSTQYNSGVGAFIGRAATSGDYVDAHLQEIRIQSVDRSAQWLLTEYHNQNDPGLFWDPSQPQDPPPPPPPAQTEFNEPEGFELIYYNDGSASSPHLSTGAGYGGPGWTSLRDDGSGDLVVALRSDAELVSMGYPPNPTGSGYSLEFYHPASINQDMSPNWNVLFADIPGVSDGPWGELYMRMTINMMGNPCHGTKIAYISFPGDTSQNDFYPTLGVDSNWDAMARPVIGSNRGSPNPTGSYVIKDSTAGAMTQERAPLYGKDSDDMVLEYRFKASSSVDAPDGEVDFWVDDALLAYKDWYGYNQPWDGEGSARQLHFNIPGVSLSNAFDGMIWQNSIQSNPHESGCSESHTYLIRELKIMGKPVAGNDGSSFIHG